VNFANGKKHDFKIFKDSKVHLNEATTLLADSAYQSINKIHANSKIPQKRYKGHPLTKEEKRENHEISSKRVKVENVIGFLKRFKILSERYRNRRKAFGLRFSLIAGICNFDTAA
jgi:pyruvate-formate lyase-activating enzyme